MSAPAPGTFRDIYSVSRLTTETRLTLEGRFPALWVEGEISNLARPGSGHVYFSLKDAAAQVRCAMFKPRSQQLAFRPENGQQVLARARVSLYEPRGDFQLIIEHLEPAGDGALRLAFEALKLKLAAAGLFESARKRELPRLPRAVGVVTSPTGAAIRDVLAVLARRWPTLPIILYPCLVQGGQAAGSIVQALQAAGRRAEVDVLLLVRGGGSLEDLWPFNEERVAEAIAACPIPVVSGVGHETDVSIADWVADLRAATPSAAAELVCPDRVALVAEVRTLALRLRRDLRRLLEQRRSRLDLARSRLVHPARRLEQLNQRLDELGLRARHALATQTQATRLRLERLEGRLGKRHPADRITALVTRLTGLSQRHRRALGWLLQARRERLQNVAALLLQVSPQATLARGYAIVRQPGKGPILRRAAEATAGSPLEVQLAEGLLTVRVERVDGS